MLRGHKINGAGSSGPHCRVFAGYGDEEASAKWITARNPAGITVIHGTQEANALQREIRYAHRGIVSLFYCEAAPPTRGYVSASLTRNSTYCQGIITNIFVIRLFFAY